jgi:hypothetical protein
MPSHRYRRNAAECLDRAAEARRSEDVDAWLSIAEEWLRLAVESDTAKKQSGAVTATIALEQSKLDAR